MDHRVNKIFQLRSVLGQLIPIVIFTNGFPKIRFL
jgi:hypothetical protein